MSPQLMSKKDIKGSTDKGSVSKILLFRYTFRKAAGYLRAVHTP